MMRCWSLLWLFFLLTGVAQASHADTSHSFNQVIELAKQRATRADAPEKLDLSGVFRDLSYDQYRGIRFRADHNPLADSGSDFALDLLPPGLLYKDRILIDLVRDGQVQRLPFDPQALDFAENLFTPEQAHISDEDVTKLGWSGFRIRYPINTPEVGDEIAVFQGASYFRAVARDTLYGLSARGLAIGTGSPKGEEFPRFTHFWIHQPAPGARTIRVEALLESASLTGAYAFDITPGAETIFVVQAIIFPRQTLSDFGIAPLTSMYYFSPAQRARIDDYRNAVHDSEGLSMLTGADIRLWRPLANPPRLQFSAFQDHDPKGFGLIQRSRAFADYEDGEARYEARPSAWIVPRGAWGDGAISLVEIPVSNEFNDNIVTFWKPKEALQAGKRYDFNYDLIWSAEGSPFSRRARIVDTRSGRSVNHENQYSFSVDFIPSNTQAWLDPNTLKLNVQTSAGKIVAAHLSTPEGHGTLRASFEFQPNTAEQADLSLNISAGNDQIAEHWLYRWIKR